MTSPARWIALGALALAATAALSLLRIPAAALLGPMAAAAVLAGSGRPVQLPPALFTAAQALVGIMIARVFTPALLAEAAQRWPLFLAAVVSVLAAACLIGFALSRWRVLPGTAALWGAFPGAATTMVLMAGDFGADVRLVAFMQYFRVVLVALVASAVARFALPQHGSGAPALSGLLAPIDAVALAATLATAALGTLAGRIARLPAPALLGPMVLGTVLHGAGWLRIELPPLLLASAYAIVGTAVGLRFDRAVLATIGRSLPRIAASLVLLIGIGALLSLALVHLAGVDPLTAYLAMSPGGADSVAIIAAASPRVDVAFVMAMQVSRFAMILLFGPALARRVARWAEPSVDPRRQPSTPKARSIVAPVATRTPGHGEKKQ